LSSWRGGEVDWLRNKSRLNIVVMQKAIPFSWENRGKIFGGSPLSGDLGKGSPTMKFVFSGEKSRRYRGDTKGPVGEQRTFTFKAVLKDSLGQRTMEGGNDKRGARHRGREGAFGGRERNQS